MNQISLQTNFFGAPHSFLDVAELNAHVSDVLIARLQAVRESAKNATTCIAHAMVVLGAAGAGKTHVLARIRNQGPGQGDAATQAAVVLLRPFFGVNTTPRDVLMAIVDQLSTPIASDGLSPLDRILAYWLSTESAAIAFPQSTLEEWRSLSGADAESRMVSVIERVIEHAPNLAPGSGLLRALLMLPKQGGPERWQASSRLSGRDLISSERIGDEVGDEAERLSEHDVLLSLRIWSILSAPVTPLLLAFDQLENLASDDDAQVLGYGNVIAELIDSVPYLTVAQFALTSEWLQYIEPRLSLPHRTRIAGEVLKLEGPSERVREQLLRVWHRQLTSELAGGRRRRFPSPLTNDDLQLLLHTPGMTPRMLLLGLKRSLNGEAVFAEPSSEASVASERSVDDVLTELFATEINTQKERRASAPEVAIDTVQLAEGLAAICQLTTKLSARVKRERERLLVEVGGGGDTLTLVLVQSTHSRTVSTALTRASEMAIAEKTMVIRSDALTLPETWKKANECRRVFERLANARWHALSNDDVARALALADLESRARAKRLQDPHSLRTFELADLRRALRDEAASWPVLSAILRALSDVPRENVRPTAVRAVPVEHVHSAPIEPTQVPSLRQWLSMGRHVARDVLLPLAARLRALRGK
jgi:hypothetical protein